jgi:uncharacterized integral membrane protein (TIGR00698 family)
LALAAAVALAATFVSRLHGGPQLLYALFFGIALHFLANRPALRPGVELGARGVLRLGVGLLGARITAEQVLALGWPTALVVLAAVASTLAFALWLGRQLGMSSARCVLSGGAVAICGASAALAISAVLPREKDGERFTLMVVVSVTVLSTVAMVLYPLLVRAMHWPPALGGLFLGGTIHDVAQVVGAGYTIDHATGDVATIVKLFRVALLALVVGLVAWAFRSQRAEQAARDAQARPGRPAARQPLLPWFLWLFVALVAVNSAVAVPEAVSQALNTASRACLVLAIAALGIKTSFAQLARMGWRPVALIVAETLWLAAFVGLALLWLAR